MKINLMGLDREELSDFCESLGEKKFRGKQLFQWIYSGEEEFCAMSNLSESFRKKLGEHAYIGLPKIKEVQRDRKDGTCKFLYELEDGNAVEGVFMRYKYGNSLCLSSQVGCRMGCKFCASALGGFVRNLTQGEMLGQIYAAEKETGEQINHIVVMGMGEPFDNYENLSKFLKLIHDKDGKNLSSRNITVSTSGIIPMMKRFSEDFPQVNLAISLHRLTQEGRCRIMPISRRYPVDDLLQAAKEYTHLTGRRITFEYTLIRGENDAPGDVELIRQKLKGMLCHVNLIPLNKVEETGFEGSNRKRAIEIAEELQQCGIAATVRRELGSEIDGACGQLRLHSKESNNGR